VIRTRRFLAALVASCSALLAFASFASAQQVLYGANGARGIPSNLYILNPSSGAVLQNVGPIGFAVTGLAVDPTTGTLYGSTGQQGRPPGGAPNPGSLITINKTTGAGTLVGDQRPDDETAADITFTPDGALFGWLEDGSDDLVTIDKASGAATIVGNSGLDTFGSGLASDSAGTLFFAGEGDDGPLRTVNRATGSTGQVATLNGTAGDPIAALAFNSAGTLFGVRIDFNLDARPTDLLTINTTSGAITSLGPSVDRLDAIVFAPKPGRSVNLKKKVKKGGKVRLFGHVDAPGNEAACANGQTVELQRKKPKGGKFGVFRQLKTNTAGDYSTKVKVKKTFTYRAFLPEISLCDDVTSKKQKVKKKKKKK
jgi:hypothetical protein